MVDVVSPDPVTRCGQSADLLPGQVPVLDRIEGEVELGDHPASLEQRQDLLDPIVRSVVEADDHRSLRERRPLVPVRGEIARQDRRVPVEEEPVELGGKGGRQDVIGREPALPRSRPARVVRRDRLDAVVVEDRHRRRRVGRRHDRDRRDGRAMAGRPARASSTAPAAPRPPRRAPGSARPDRRPRRPGQGRRHCTRTCRRRTRATRPRSRAGPRTGGRGWLVRSAGVVPSSSFDPDLESRVPSSRPRACRGPTRSRNVAPADPSSAQAWPARRPNAGGSGQPLGSHRLTSVVVCKP